MDVEGQMELIGHEAIVLTRYRDSVGVWTLGIGHTKAAGPPDPETFFQSLTIEQAIALFIEDLRAYEDAVERAVKVSVSQTQFNALVSFHYNTGAIGRASLVDSINKGDFELAAKRFMAWNKPPEVIGRRTKEMELFRDGKYSNDRKARVIPADDDGRVLWKKGQTLNLEKVMKNVPAAKPPLVASAKPTKPIPPVVQPKPLTVWQRIAKAFGFQV